jgi:hypothetical protein
LHLECADIDPVVDHPWKTGAALIEIRRRRKARIAHVDGRAAGQQCVRKGWAAVVLQRAEHRVSADHVAGVGTVDKTRRAILNQTVLRVDRTGGALTIAACAVGDDTAVETQRACVVVDAAAGDVG